MLKKAFVFALLGLGLLVAKAPATLLDSAAQEAFDGAVRLEQLEGTLWNGSAVLVLQGAMHAPVAWQFTPSRLLRGELVWSGATGSALQGELTVTPSGFSVHKLLFSAPARLVLPLVPGTLAHAGWGGRLSLQAEEWLCIKDRSCRGRLYLHWQDASCALLQGQRFGSYSLDLLGTGQRISLVARTLAGDVEIMGRGSIGTDARDGTFAGRITAPPPTLRLLPSIASGLVYPDGNAGGLGIAYPSRHISR